MAGMCGRPHSTKASIPITVSPAKKIGCFAKSITTMTKQSSNLLTETAFFRPRHPGKQFVAKAGIRKFRPV
jgi:hypothetical protein